VKLEEMPAPARQLLETLAIATHHCPKRSRSPPRHSRQAIGQRRPIGGGALRRVRETSDSRQIEIYHDRLRKIIVASMSPDTLRQRHRALATVLQTLPSVDPAVLSIHYRECGDVTRAAEYAIATADQASNALAFERAATWYAAALEHGALNRDESVGLQRKLAEALAFAGRGQRPRTRTSKRRRRRTRRRVRNYGGLRQSNCCDPGTSIRDSPSSKTPVASWASGFREAMADSAVTGRPSASVRRCQPSGFAANRRAISRRRA
jgi:hypothetical protein